MGWESQGWTEKKAVARLSELKEAQRTGIGEITLAGKRRVAKEKADVEAMVLEQMAKDNITFSEVFQRYIEQAFEDKEKKTCIEEQSKYNKWILPLFKNKPLKEISLFMLEKLKKCMADEEKAPRTITYVLALIRQVFNYAKNHDLYHGDNPVSKVKKPSEDNRRVHFLSHEEADLLLNELARVSPMLYNISLLSLHCGLRAGEIFNLEWSDIDFANETILIKDTKSGRNRNAITTKNVKTMFEKMDKYDHTNIVFLSRKGEKTTEVSRSFDRAIDKLGFNKGIMARRQKVVFHTLRYTYASWLVISGVDLYTIQRLMGHSTISMTEIFAFSFKSS